MGKKHGKFATEHFVNATFGQQELRVVDIMNMSIFLTT